MPICLTHAPDLGRSQRLHIELQSSFIWLMNFQSYFVYENLFEMKSFLKNHKYNRFSRKQISELVGWKIWISKASKNLTHDIHINLQTWSLGSLSSVEKKTNVTVKVDLYNRNDKLSIFPAFFFVFVSSTVIVFWISQ